MNTQREESWPLVKELMAKMFQNLQRSADDIVKSQASASEIWQIMKDGQKQSPSEDPAEAQHKPHGVERIDLLHNLMVNSAKSLEVSTVSVRENIQKLHNKQDTVNPNSKPVATLNKVNNAIRQIGGEPISSNLTGLIQNHQELRDLLKDQSDEYSKLQKAHGILLGKLKEHQEFIKKLQSERSESDARDNEAAARLEGLRSLVESSDPKIPSPSQLHGIPLSVSRRVEPSSISIPSSDIEEPFLPPHENQAVIATQALEQERPIPSSEQAAPTEATVHLEAVPFVTHVANPSTDVIDDSQPQFVFERPVKRRRTGKSSRTNYGNVLIKTENTTADVLTSDDGPASLDLDAVYTPIVATSRQAEELFPSRSLAPNIRTTSGKTHRHSEPPRIPAGSEIITAVPSTEPSSNSDFQALVKNEQIERQSAVEEDNIQQTPRLNDRVTYQETRSYRPVLHPKTPNARIIKQKYTASSDKAYKNLSVENLQTIEGEALEAQPTPATSLARKTLSPSKSTRKLNTSKTKEGLQPATTTSKEASSGRKRHAIDDRRLRDKDVNELSLSDFKLNPAINHGFNQTFGGYNPNKETRHCLPGCSKPECCGNALAVAIRNAGINSIQDMSTRAKNGVIESYLGFPVSNLGHISNQAYQKLFGEAIGKQLAIKHSKQKELRADSPPGYWRVDFPSTQERLVDGEKAEDIEKKTIEGRRKEALIDGGIWMFRDE